TYGKFRTYFYLSKNCFVGYDFLFIIPFKTPIEQKLGVFSHMENIYV
ncbi:hypothetical protein LLT6_06810, partial [Lactococcus cremoris subsp. cremoris TIFN6]